MLDSGQPRLVSRTYRVVWGVIALGVMVLPTYPQESLFVFPAVLALGATWLLTMPQLGHSIR